MGTTYNPQANYHYNERSVIRAKASLWVVPVARFFFSFIFILAGFNHFSSGSVSYAAAQGIPIPDILVPVSGLIAIVGGLSVLLGIHARMGAALLLIFLVPVTLLMHNFWAVADPQMAQTQMTNFLKNLSLIGGALLVLFYGAGPISFDNHRARKAPRS
jgi:putative oxidoreductase